MDRFRINKKLLPIKVHYFLINGAHSGVIPFVPVYAKQLGISASAVGIIYAILSCLTVISRPIIGGFVDRLQKLKQVLIMLILVDIAADMGLNFIPKSPQQQMAVTNFKLLCYQRSSYLIGYNWSDCGSEFLNLSRDCIVSCTLCQSESSFCAEDSQFSNDEGSLRKNNPIFSEGVDSKFNTLNSTETPSHTLNSSESLLAKCTYNLYSKCSETCYVKKNCETGTEVNPLKQLCMLSIFIALMYIANGSIVSLSDAACYNALEEEPQKFGNQRMWGTIGWGLFALLTGYLNQVFTGTSEEYNFSSGFYMLIALFVIDLYIISKQELKDVKVSKHIFRDVGLLIIKPKIFAFILAVFLIGLATGLSRSYIFWYLRTTLNADQIILGSVSGVQCFLGELPFFFLSGWIIKRLGHIHTFSMSFVAYGLRFMCHSFLLEPLLALPIEILQGPCFGSFYSAMTSYARVIAPEGTEATVQGLVSGTFEGLGVAAGSLLGGFCISAYGGRKTFFWSGIIFVLMGLFHSAMYITMKWKNTPDSTNPDGQSSAKP